MDWAVGNLHGDCLAKALVTTALQALNAAAFCRGGAVLSSRSQPHEERGPQRTGLTLGLHPPRPLQRPACPVNSGTGLPSLQHGLSLSTAAKLLFRAFRFSLNPSKAPILHPMT